MLKKIAHYDNGRGSTSTLYSAAGRTVELREGLGEDLEAAFADLTGDEKVAKRAAQGHGGTAVRSQEARRDTAPAPGGTQEIDLREPGQILDTKQRARQLRGVADTLQKRGRAIEAQRLLQEAESELRQLAQQQQQQIAALRQGQQPPAGRSTSLRETMRRADDLETWLRENLDPALESFNPELKALRERNRR